MEESINSSTSSCAFSDEDNSSEESSWAMYLEDFMASEEEDEQKKAAAAAADGVGCFLSPSFLSYSSMISSVVSSGAPRKLLASSPESRPPEEGSSNLRRKKRKVQWGFVEEEDHDPLADTASSSPTNYNLKGDDTSEARNKYLVDGLEWCCFKERPISERTELNRRGMQLVPLSMLIQDLDN